MALREVCEFKYGKSLPESLREAGPVAVYGSNGPVGTHDQALTDGPAIVIGRKGSFGEVNYSSQACWPIDTTYYVDRTSTRVDLRWLTYRLGALGLNKLNRAAAVPGLNREDAYRQRLLLPPLSEQRRIAEVLDKADALRAKRRAALAELDALTHSFFLDMFGDPALNPHGWPTTQLGDLISTGPQNGLYKPAIEYGSGTPILRIDGFYDGAVTGLESLKRVRLTQRDKSTYSLHPGDIVINRVNSREYLGKSALIPQPPEPTVFESNIMRFRVDGTKADPGYMIQLLQTQYLRKQILQAAKDAVNQSSINQQDVKALTVLLPPLTIQHQFAKRSRTIHRIRIDQRHSATALDELFASLQDRASRGEF